MQIKSVTESLKIALAIAGMLQRGWALPHPVRRSFVVDI